MGKSIPAIVTPEVLRWARGLDEISLEEIALKLKVDVSKIEAWENGRSIQLYRKQKNLLSNIVSPLLTYIFLILRKRRKDWIRWITEHLAIGELMECLVNLDGFLET